MKTSKAVSTILVAVMLLLLGCSKSSDPASSDPREKWVGTWTGFPLIDLSGNPCDGSSSQEIISTTNLVLIVTKSSLDENVIILDCNFFSTIATISTTSNLAIPQTTPDLRGSSLPDVTFPTNLTIDSNGLLNGEFYVTGGTCTLNGHFYQLYDKYLFKQAK